MSFLNGKEFKAKYPDTYVKLITSFESENVFGVNVDYKTGLVIDPPKNHPPGTMEGIQFCSIHKLGSCFEPDTYFLRYVTIPDDGRIYITSDNKFKTDKLILSERINIKDLELWDSDLFCQKSTEQNVNCIRCVKKQTNEMCLKVVKKDGKLLKYVKNKTAEICLEAVTQNGEAFRFITDKIKKQFIEEFGKDETDRLMSHIYMAAVSSYGSALSYIPAKSQTREICLAAVMQYSYSLEYVKKQTNEICLAAILNCKQNYEYDHVFKDVKDKNEWICMEAVKHNGCLLDYIENQTLEMCLEAVKTCKCSLKYVKEEFKDKVKESLAGPVQ
jgi:hypothetical protein